MNFNFIFKTIYKKKKYHRKKNENDNTHTKFSWVIGWLSLVI